MSTKKTKNKEPDPDEIDFHGCPAVGVGGYHSQEYEDDEGCRWCGASYRTDNIVQTPKVR